MFKNELIMIVLAFMCITNLYIYCNLQKPYKVKSEKIKIVKDLDKTDLDLIKTPNITEYFISNPSVLH